MFRDDEAPEGDVERLIATSRELMWNQQVSGARFQRIEGGAADPGWRKSPGVFWSALVPYDSTLRKVFLANHRPDGWGGLSLRVGAKISSGGGA